MTKLVDLARTVRSKNVGPFMMSLDIVFDDRETYERVVKANVITRESIARLYRIDPERITDVVYYTPGNAIKVSMLRPIPSGSFGDADVLGSQQYAVLHDIEVPDERRTTLKAGRAVGSASRGAHGASRNRPRRQRPPPAKRRR